MQGTKRLNTSRIHLDRFAAAAAASLPSGSLVLDAGAGNCPYKPHFADRGIRYESADFGEVDKPYGDLTFRCSLEALPVAQDRYDLVLMTQVLEHLREPGRVLAEMFRVLRPGGTLWLSAPLFYPEHEQPHDYYRYTQYGFRHLLTAAGFELERLEWLEGYFGTLSYQFSRAAVNLPRRPHYYGGDVVTAFMAACARPMLRVMARRLARADLKVKFTGAGHCKNYCMVARKPPAGEAGAPAPASSEAVS